MGVAAMAVARIHPTLLGMTGVQAGAGSSGLALLLAVVCLGAGLAHGDPLLRTGRSRAHQLVLPGNTTAGWPVDASSTCSITSKGQVTIPKALRQQLGLARGSRVSFQLVGDHIKVRPCKPRQLVNSSGFGLLKSQCPPVPVDFDPASQLRP